MAGARFVRSVVNSIKAASFFAVYGLELIVKRPTDIRSGAEWLNRFTRAVVKGFNVKVTLEGRFPERGVVISDHLSYMDIIVYASLHPVVYCSKAEVEHMPVLGFMAMSAGTVMIERGAGGSAERAKVGMQAAAAEGVPVVFFPEGTTTTGYEMLPFKTGLLAVSLEAEQPIYASFIHYLIEQDNGPDVSLHDDVCWGETPMLKHIFKFVGLQGVHCFVKVSPEPIHFSQPEREIDRKQAAVEARAALLALSGDWYAANPAPQAVDEEMLHQG